MKYLLNTTQSIKDSDGTNLLSRCFILVGFSGLADSFVGMPGLLSITLRGTDKQPCSDIVKEDDITSGIFLSGPERLFQYIANLFIVHAHLWQAIKQDPIRDMGYNSLNF